MSPFKNHTQPESCECAVFFPYCWLWEGEFTTQLLSPCSHGHLGTSPLKDSSCSAECPEPLQTGRDQSPGDLALPPSTRAVIPVLNLLIVHYASGQRKAFCFSKVFCSSSKVLFKLLNPPFRRGTWIKMMTMLNGGYIIIKIYSLCL